MIFSCKYIKDSGKITEWCKGESLNAVNLLSQSQSSDSTPLSFGIVASYPKEVLEHTGQWALHNLQIKSVNENGTVEVELAG
jgi:hypothetical protein